MFYKVSFTVFLVTETKREITVCFDYYLDSSSASSQARTVSDIVLQTETDNIYGIESAEIARWLAKSNACPPV